MVDFYFLSICVFFLSIILVFYLDTNLLVTLNDRENIRFSFLMCVDTYGKINSFYSRYMYPFSSGLNFPVCFLMTGKNFVFVFYVC